MQRLPLRLTSLSLMLLLALGCAVDGASDAAADLGDFPAIGKADTPLVVEVPFVVPPSTEDGVPGEMAPLTFRTSGQLAVTTHQDEELSWERLQLVAESDDYRRRSWRGRAPYVTIPAAQTGGELTEYSLTMLNWGDVTAHGFIRVETEVPEEGVKAVFNSPDCDDGCEDPAGALRTELVDAIQSARHSIDLAVYGLEDETIVEALCNAAEAGVRVRVVTDETSEDPENSRTYWPAFFGPDGLASCGAEVDAVRSYGLMHHKFFVIDAGTGAELLITGSLNLTQNGFDRNHNHMLFLRDAPELAAAYVAELEQFLRHCAVDRLEESTRCDECTPACTEDVNDSGPWPMPNGQVQAFFSPADDAMRVLRGLTHEARLEAPDPACNGEDADCVCRVAGSRWLCEYCAQGEDGWGVIGEADDRILMTMYSATDQCFALGAVRAARRGVEVVTIWDYVRSRSRYSRDDHMCSEGIPTYISNWGGGSPLVRNHNKTVIVDDLVFDGSMNLGASGAAQNNENTLVIDSAPLAATFAEYIREEVALLERSGVLPQDAATCRCQDLIDNDGDGLADADDPDCDAGS